MQAPIALVNIHLQRGESEEALELATAQSEKWPDNPAILNLLGHTHETLEQPARAIESYTRALEANPGFAPAVLNLARLETLAGKRAQARGRYEMLLEHKPHHPDVLLRLAQLVIEDDDPNYGTTLLEQASEHNPRHVASRLLLIDRLLLDGRPQAALTAAKEVEALAPMLPEVQLAIARVELVNGQAERARQRIQRIPGYHSKSVHFQISLALAQSALGDFDKARMSFQRALRVDAKQSDALEGLGHLAIRDKDFDEALNFAKMIQKHFPEQARGYRFEGDVHLLAKHHAEAITAYRTALGLTTDSGVLVSLSRAYRGSNRSSEGSEVLRRWLDGQPDDIVVRAELAQHALTDGDIDTAVNELARIVELSPNNVAALNDLAYLYQQRNDARALDLARRAYDLAPDEPVVMDTYGWLLTNNGNVQQALPILRKSVERASGRPTHRYHFAVALLRAGLQVEAKEQLGLLMTLPGKFPEKQQASELLEVVTNMLSKQAQ